MPCRDLLIYLRELNGQPTTWKWLLMDRYQNCQRVDVEWIHMLLTNSWYHIDPYQGTKICLGSNPRIFKPSIFEPQLAVFWYFSKISQNSPSICISKFWNRALNCRSYGKIYLGWILGYIEFRGKLLGFILLMIFLNFAQTGHFLAENQELENSRNSY